MKFLQTISNFGSKMIIKGKKYSPEIAFASGMLMLGGAIIFSSISALKIENILDERDETQNKIDEEPVSSSYTQKNKDDDTLKLKLRTFRKIGVAYLPTVGLAVVGTGLTVYAFCEMKRRYVAAVALYNGLSTFFQSYRARVQDKLGIEEEQKLYLAERTDTTIELNKKGEEVEKKEQHLNIEGTSQYAKLFTEYLPNGSKNSDWDKNRNFNLMFIRSRENMANDTLNRRGHIFLNEVYDSLGLPHTKEGSLVGWVKGHGDDVVDFGVYLNERESVKNYIRDNQLGDSSLLLDFNVDGVIYDLI